MKVKFIAALLILCLTLSSCIKIVVPGNDDGTSKETVSSEKESSEETEKTSEEEEETKASSKETEKETESEAPEKEPEKAVLEGLPIKDTEYYHYIEGNISANCNIFGYYVASAEARFEAVSRAIQKENAEAFQRFKDFSEEVKKAQEESSGVKMQYSYGEYLIPGRMDTKVVSYVRRAEGYMGGAHGYENYFCLNADAVTGKELSLSDVVKDKGALSDAIIDNIEKRFTDEELADNWRGTVKEVISEEVLVYLLSGSGMEVFFEPYLLGPGALGTVNVVIPMKKCGTILKEDYLLSDDTLIWKMADSGDQELRDYSGDGKADYLNIEVMFFAEDDIDLQSVEVTYGKDEESAKKVDIGNQYKVDNVYLANAGGKTFVLTEARLLNDNRQVTVIDLSDPANGPEILDSYEFGLVDGPVNSANFYIRTYKDSLSTYLGVASASLDAEGKITVNSGYFAGEPDLDTMFGQRNALPALSMYEYAVMHVIKDIPAKEVSEKLEIGGDTVIKNGSDLRGYYIVDDESLIVFDDNHQFYMISFEYKNYEYYIDGISVYDYFSNLYYGS